MALVDPIPAWLAVFAATLLAVAMPPVDEPVAVARALLTLVADAGAPPPWPP
jgi:hypothetical protein